MVNLYEKIRKLCKEQRITVKALEIATGMSNGTISGWEVSAPSAYRLKAVANVLGVTVDELLEDGPADETCRKLDETL